MEEKFRCPKCGSSQTRYRFKTNDRVCYVCGECSRSFKIEKKEEVNDGSS